MRDGYGFGRARFVVFEVGMGVEWTGFGALRRRFGYG